MNSRRSSNVVTAARSWDTAKHLSGILNHIPSLYTAVIHELFGQGRTLIKHHIYHRGCRRVEEATLINRPQSDTVINCWGHNRWRIWIERFSFAGGGLLAGSRWWDGWMDGWMVLNLATASPISAGCVAMPGKDFRNPIKKLQSSASGYWLI